jgi:Ca2+/Na+ antiporter
MEYQHSRKLWPLAAIKTLTEMLIEKNFSPSDTMKVETDHKKYRKYLFYLVIICVPMGFLIGYFVSLIKHIPFWTAIVIEFTILFLIFYFIFFRKLKSFKKELLEQIKLVGEVKVKSKSEKNGQYIICCDSTQMENILVRQNLYDKTNIGDTFAIEISKYSKSILKLSKNGEVIVNGG